jgi:hypothetical protein
VTNLFSPIRLVALERHRIGQFAAGAVEVRGAAGTPRPDGGILHQ